MTPDVPWLAYASLIVSVVSIVATASLAIIGFRRALERDREENWQKAKLELYGDFINSLMEFVLNSKGEPPKLIKINYLEKLNKMTLLGHYETVMLSYSIVDSLTTITDQDGFNQCIKKIQKLISLMRAEIIPKRHHISNEGVFEPRLFYVQNSDHFL